ncbi:esterase [Pseudonocardia sulfidoxydans NBRC 16205]|uniref:Esterase n=1 Tax=Pseudonocardia sulfidoxydans NBRC 16205 TaxID=1223511 RepID=A0A511D8W7_9PSEU|nr:alpha/beta hydrolase [Pseudonocardia sulfidoxydans]GEL21245.1 esterase [Pseudonocardia sulfidoxydans NBRC 16205]
MSTGPRVVGTGPNRVLAFHGWFGSSAGWGHFPEYVDQEQFSYAFLDCRGYGRRKDVTGEYTMEEISADALAAADALGWDTFHLLGHSMGAFAMQHLLVAAPERVQKLYSLSGVPATGGQLDDQVLGMFSAAPQSLEARIGLTHFATGSRLPDSFAARIATESQANSTVEAFAGHLLPWARGTDISEQVRGLKHPVKALVGEYDPALTEEVSRATWLEFFPDCEIGTIPNTGHYAMYEAPAWLAASVEEFFLRRV